MLPFRAGAAAPEPAVFAVTLNHEALGDFTVYLADGDDILVKKADLVAMGFRDPAGGTVTIAGETCISLRSMRKVAFRIDKKTVSLKIAASPRLLERQVIDLVARGDRDVARPRNGSFFVNYGLDYREDDAGFRRWSVTGEAGARAGDALLITDSSYRGAGNEREFVRLMSRLVYDRRAEMQRLTLGDFAAATGELGGHVIMAGVGFEKNYDLDPYFIRNPVFGLAGVSALPAEVEISVGGVVLRREKISPGNFEVANLWTTGGIKRVDVKIRDVFGGETRLEGGFYFTDRLLRQGVSEYGYNLGFLREKYGVESNEYGPLAFAARHRYGVSDGLSAGLATEGGDGLLNGGLSLSFTAGRLGLVTAAARGSRKDGETGSAGRLTYTFQGGGFVANLGAKRQSREYLALGQSRSESQTRQILEAAAGYGCSRLGSLSLGFTAEESFAGRERRTAALFYGVDLPWAISLSAGVRRVSGDTSADEVFLTLAWAGARARAAGRFVSREGEATTSLEISQHPPPGEGISYRAAGQNTGGQNTASLELQYNGRYGIYRAEAEGYAAAGGVRNASLELYTAGSFAMAGGAFAIGRPVHDAFGVVEVGGIEGVRVLHSNTEIGRTDAQGRVFLPVLDSYHDNEISIDDRDIPMGYTIAALKKYVSPASRQGTIVSFDVQRFQAVSGFLQTVTSRGLAPLEERRGVVTVGEKQVAFPTGKGGEFYLENVPPGSYKAVVTVNGKNAHCVILVPRSEEILIELGKITCELR